MTSTDSRILHIDDIMLRCTLNVQTSQDSMAVTCPIVESSLQNNRGRAWAAAEPVELAKFTEGDYVLVSGE